MQIRIWAQQILSEKMNEPKTKYKKKSLILSQKQVYMLHKIDTWFSIIDLIHQKIDLSSTHIRTSYAILFIIIRNYTRQHTLESTGVKIFLADRGLQ